MMNDIFQRALGITSPWFIKSINFDENIKRLDIEVDFKRGATFIDDSEDVDTPKAYTAYSHSRSCTNPRKIKRLSSF